MALDLPATRFARLLLAAALLAGAGVALPTLLPVGQVVAASGGNVSPDLDSTHTGGPFPYGPLSATQIAEIAAYVRSS